MASEKWSEVVRTKEANPDPVDDIVFSERISEGLCDELVY